MLRFSCRGHENGARRKLALNEQVVWERNAPAQMLYDYGYGAHGYFAQDGGLMTASN
jgi:hypothetical protein